MIDTTQYPSIQQILGYAEMGTEIYEWSKPLANELRSLLTSNAVNAKLAAEWEAKHHALRTQIAEMGREMASVVAERDALKAQQPKPPARKLREYKGVTYDPKCKHQFPWSTKNANGVTVNSTTLMGLLSTSNMVIADDDLSAMLALKSDPYEPVETVEEVLRDAMRACYLSGGATIAEMVSKYATRLRAAFAAEQGGAE